MIIRHLKLCLHMLTEEQQQKNECVNQGLKTSSVCELPCLLKPHSKLSGGRLNQTTHKSMQRENELHIHNGISMTSKE